MRHVVGGARLLLLTCLTLGATPSFAHHSVAGQFDQSKSLTLHGVVSRVEWINPHIYLQIDVKNEDGSATTWSIETLPTAMMRKAGLTRESILGQPGEVVTVQIVPARDGTKHLAWLQKITYGDGRFFQLG